MYNDLLQLKKFVQSDSLRIARMHQFYFHGIRFDAINRLESIFQTGSILPSNKVKPSFKSYDGEDKYLHFYKDDENCNMGEYISVMPYNDHYEYRIFIQENIFFVIKPTIYPYKTEHVSYDEYLEIRKNKVNDKLYSYAFNEYLVKDEISLDDVLYIGIDERYYNGNFDEDVKKVIKLMKVYNIEIPLIENNTCQNLFSLNNKVKVKNDLNFKINTNL